MFELSIRYAYKNRAHYLHHYYDGSWAENIPQHNSDVYNKLYKMFISEGYTEKTAHSEITRAVKLLDPSCYDLKEEYKFIQDRKKYYNKEKLALFERLTLPGLMTSIIEEAKNSNRVRPTRGQTSVWIGKFIRPTSDDYHPLFAKDLYDIKPQWCVATLSVEEQKEFLGLFISKHKRFPMKSNDKWEIPKNSIWNKFKGNLQPSPNSISKKFGDIELLVANIEMQLKQGKKPKEWNNFEYNYPEQAKELAEKYLEVVNKQKWLKINLTESQQTQVDKWLKVEELVSTDEPDDKLLARLTSEERSLVGNYFKQLDASRSRKGDKKISEYINPIVNRLKEKRPELYKHYTTKKVKTNTTHSFYDITGPGAKNKETMEALFQLAKSGADRPNDRSTNTSLNRFTGKNTRYPEFAEEIRKLRPEWFDQKLLAKDRSDRFHKRGKYKETT
jgi:hypothetical protein